MWVFGHLVGCKYSGRKSKPPADLKDKQFMEKVLQCVENSEINLSLDL